MGPAYLATPPLPLPQQVTRPALAPAGAGLPARHVAQVIQQQAAVEVQGGQLVLQPGAGAGSFQSSPDIALRRMLREYGAGLVLGTMAW